MDPLSSGKLNGYLPILLIPLIVAGIVGMVVMYGVTRATDTRVSALEAEVCTLRTFTQETRSIQNSVRERLSDLEARKEWNYKNKEWHYGK
jgi:hypothetical protein